MPFPPQNEPANKTTEIDPVNQRRECLQLALLLNS